MTQLFQQIDLSRLSLESLTQYAGELQCELDRVQTARAEAVKQKDAIPLPDPTKTVGTATTLELLHFRMGHISERNSHPAGSAEAEQASMMIQFIEQELTERSEGGIQMVRDEAFLFAGGKCYWGQDAMNMLWRQPQ